MQEQPSSNFASTRHHVKIATVVALPIVLFLLIRWWRDPSITQADRELRRRVGEVAKVEVSRLKWSRVRDERDGEYSRQGDSQLLCVLRVQAARDLLLRLRLKEIDDQPKWTLTPAGRREYSDLMNHPVMQIVFDFYRADGSRMSFYLDQGRLRGGRGGGIEEHESPPFGWLGAPLQDSTKAYLKQLLKPYHIPSELIDGNGPQSHSR